MAALCRHYGTTVLFVSRNKLEEMSGLPKDLVLYSARHTFATDMLDKTGNLSLVLKMLGDMSPYSQRNATCIRS